MTRFHELDALRAFAMLLGVVLHASLFLATKEWPIVAKEYSTDLPYDDIVMAIHGFRMPVFFLLSGFFTALLWHRLGIKSLIEHRLRRVGLPLLIGAFTVIPVQVIGVVLVTEWNLTPTEMLWIVALGWLDNLHHLWFLWVLLLLVGIFVLLTSIGIKFSHRFVWWLMLPGVLIPQLLMREPTWGADTSATVFTNPVVLTYYLCFFLFGAFMFQAKITPHDQWATALVPVVPIFYVGLHFEFVSKSEWASYVSAVLQVSYAWAMCVGLMGIFKIFASAHQSWIRYASDASYWIYLWHLALIFPAQALAARLDWNVHLEMALIIFGVTAILLSVYQLAVRHTWIGTMLNGRRERRAENDVDQSRPSHQVA